MVDGSIQPTQKGFRVDYHIYEMGRGERTRYIVLAALALFAVSFVFFQSLTLSFLFSLGCFFYPKYKVKDLVRKRKSELNNQFKDALYALSSALGAGRSMEMAFKSALSDLRIIYPDEKTYIIQEFQYICRRIEMNDPVEKALADFGRRSHIEDIINFADVVMICMKTGGSLVNVVKSTSGAISDKIEIEQEIDMILSGKKYEQKLLNIMPLVFIGLINLGGSGYTDPLYKSATGYLLMALSMGILVAAYFISRRIMDIKV